MQGVPVLGPIARMLYSYAGPVVTSVSSAIGPLQGGLRLTVFGSGYGLSDGKKIYVR
jgi:hypothetical protein